MEAVICKTACVLCRREDEVVQNQETALERHLENGSEGSRADLLIQACQCKKYVHSSCLKTQVQKEVVTRCSQCLQTYQVAIIGYEYDYENQVRGK